METADHISHVNITDYADELETICQELEAALEDICNVISKDHFSRHWIIPASDSWAIDRAESALKKARGIP
jgi:hypothetical protein